MSFALRAMRPEDWPAVEQIYAAGIATGHATFEIATPAWAEWDAAHLATPRLVADEGGVAVGWAALSPASRRAVYRGVAEVSVYVAPEAWGRGVGRLLLDALVRASEEAGLWTLQASVFAGNHASLKLHERAGFRRVGVRERIARRDGRWHDTVILERRSAVVGAPS
ncbi:MAG: GNAT family N-acetyltransferase [Gemmatimonadota bacterium]|nr:GNAT family N-acetyltransferase [Gemmatimonadota bacterium]MDH5284162.1 GNAT family N-acetyltransferase [Gemmatimonadota bacterium]